MPAEAIQQLEFSVSTRLALRCRQQEVPECQPEYVVQRSISRLRRHATFQTKRLLESEYSLRKDSLRHRLTQNFSLCFTFRQDGERRPGFLHAARPTQDSTRMYTRQFAISQQNNRLFETGIVAVADSAHPSARSIYGKRGSGAISPRPKGEPDSQAACPCWPSLA